MSEMVDSPDAELVSRALEMCLRAQWGDVAREGGTLVLRGLGPTHRVNRNDKAVFEVKPAGGGRTAIDADVTYQASALVGTTAPQNELVQRKLDGVLELVRMDIDLAQRRAAQQSERELKPRLVNKNSAAVFPGVEVEPPKVENPAIEHGEAATFRVAEETVPPNADRPTPLWKTPEAVSTEVSAASPPITATRVAGAGYARAVPKAPVAPPAPKAAAEQKLVHRGEDLANEEREYSKRASDRSAGKIFAMLLVVFVLAGSAQIGWQYRGGLGPRLTQWHLTQWRLAPWRSVWSGASAVDTLTPEQKAAELQAAREAAAADAEKAVEAAKLAEPDPKKWLENWADTLRGQDAGAQAAYYADTVDKYFLKRDVRRADVMADRQASIEKRKGSWTLRLENVVVAEQTDAAARILLVRYVATDPGTGTVEERLPTQIRLKRINGQWRIVSEQTLG